MEQNEGINRDGINWDVWIPVILWIACVLLGIIKVLLDTFLFVDETDVALDYIEILNAFNSNTFSTFISIVACKLYQYFSADEKGFKKEQASGLSMRNIPATFIISGVYLVVAVFDSAISLSGMAIIFFVCSLAYVICFFKIFIAKKRNG